MRIAFEIFGGTSWTGGINYLTNLLSAINELPGKSLEPILFASPKTDSATLERLSPFLAAPPVLSNLWTKGSLSNRMRFLRTLVAGRDVFAEKLFREANIDLVFVHASWFGKKFRFPTLVWIGDFQHRALPQMFSRTAYAKREYGFRLLTEHATKIMASSEAGCEECLNYFPKSRGRLVAVPFVVKVPPSADTVGVEEIKTNYKLPDKFFYLPNQFWRHKNHELFFDAVIDARKRCSDICVVCSGNPVDPRDPSYFPRLESKLDKSCSAGFIRLLGMVPYADIFALMRASLAMVNPSLYEGWSTTVEEAKALGVPVILSDIPVHREQVDGAAEFFNPNDVANVSGVLTRVWDKLATTPSSYRVQMREAAREKLILRRREFAENFLKVAIETREKWETLS